MRHKIAAGCTVAFVGALAGVLVALARSPDDRTLELLGVATLLTLVLVGLVGAERGVAARFAFAGTAVFWLATVAYIGATSSVATWLAGGASEAEGELGAPFPRLATLGSATAVCTFVLAVTLIVWLRLGEDGRARLRQRLGFAVGPPADPAAGQAD